MAKSRLRGRGRMRKLMRRLPDAFRGELIVELRVTGRQIRQAVQARTPRRKGALVAGITERVLPASLRLQVGLLGTPRGRAKLFYGRIQDLGRRAQVVTVTRHLARKVRGNGITSPRRVIYEVAGDRLRRRGPNKGTPVGSAYKMRVPAMPGKRFVTGQYPELRRTLNANLRGIWARAMGTLSGGVDE